VKIYLCWLSLLLLLIVNGAQPLKAEDTAAKVQESDEDIKATPISEAAQLWVNRVSLRDKTLKTVYEKKMYLLLNPPCGFWEEVADSEKIPGVMKGTFDEMLKQRKLLMTIKHNYTEADFRKWASAKAFDVFSRTVSVCRGIKLRLDKLKIITEGQERERIEELIENCPF